MAPTIVRTYALSFLLLPFNIFSTYYFQAIMKPKAAFVVSVARGLVISGILIMVLPALVNADAIWFAMPVTELLDHAGGHGAEEVTHDIEGGGIAIALGVDSHIGAQA